MEPQGFQNLTPFAAETLLLLDQEGAQGVTLVAKATYAIVDGALALADEQPKVVKAPVYHGDPGVSSLRYESEACFTKPATDVILLGHAQPEIGRAGEVLVSLSVGPIKKHVRVFGDRTWKRTLGLAAISTPKPFERMPLVYERAFGGAGMPNPVGVGFHRGDMEREFDGLRLPNLENPDQLLARPTDLPTPAGFGYLAADWAPRRTLAGTFDEAWKNTRCPRGGWRGDGTRQFRRDFTSSYWRSARNLMARSRESILRRRRWILARVDVYFPKALHRRRIAMPSLRT